MSNKSGFNWKYLIPVYGLFIISKSDSKSKNKLIWLNIFASVVIVAFIGGAGEDSKTVSGDTGIKQSSEQVAEKKTGWKIGDSIKTEKFEVKVSSATTGTIVGGEYMKEKAAEGAIFVIVNFSYKNITKEPIGSFSVPNMKIIDPNGTKYDETSGATSYYQAEIEINKKAFSDINPGITQKDATVFEVSKELWKSNGWKLIIDADKDIEVQIK